ncbi:MAG: Ig-like domain-containing protein, partial [Pseudomonadota bacterium]
MINFRLIKFLIFCSILSVVGGCRQKGHISKTSKNNLVQKNSSKSSETVVVKVEEDIASEIRFDVSELVAPSSACNSDFLSYSSSDPSLIASENAVTWGGVWPNCTAVFSAVANTSGSATVEIKAHYAAISITVSKLEFVVTAVDDAPLAEDITAVAFNEDTSSIITLSYFDADGDKATACALSNLSMVTITTPCACDGDGVCTVGVTGAANYNGAAGFSYTITANGAASAAATARLSITAVDDAPVAQNITPAAFSEDTASSITLSYSDVESDKATACTLSNLSLVTITTPCACDGDGVCTVGVTGTANYNGAAGFSYTITANGA